MTEEEFDFLKNLSKEKNRSIGDLIRSAVGKAYRPSSPTTHLWALDDLEKKQFFHEIGNEV